MLMVSYLILVVSVVLAEIGTQLHERQPGCAIQELTGCVRAGCMAWNIDALITSAILHFMVA